MEALKLLGIVFGTCFGSIISFILFKSCFKQFEILEKEKISHRPFYQKGCYYITMVILGYLLTIFFIGFIMSLLISMGFFLVGAVGERFYNNFVYMLGSILSFAMWITFYIAGLKWKDW